MPHKWQKPVVKVCATFQTLNTAGWIRCLPEKMGSPTNNQKAMRQNRFNIIESVRLAYVFIWQNIGYLLRYGILPFVVNLLTALAIQSYASDATPLQAFLYTFPASVFFAWYAFVLVRCLLLGERVDRLPDDTAYRAKRERLMARAIIILLLFNMAVAGCASFMMWGVNSGAFGRNSLVSVVIIFMIGGLIWSLRFGVVHILAAVDYPIRPFLSRVHGMGFSFYLIGLGALALFPVFFAFEIISRIFLPDIAEPSGASATAFLFATAPLGLLIPLLLNSAAAFALKDMLGKDKP